MANRRSRYLAWALLAVFSLEIFNPIGAYALTSGPSSPEFSSFTPVSSSNLVNPFTGDFSYSIPIVNVPGPHGSGMPLSLGYNSGVNAETEASWVGLGWSLSPGAIVRDVRGFPDDYNNAEVKYYNKSEPNWTASIQTGLSSPIPGTPLSASIGRNVGFNSYQGLRYTNSASISYGPISLTHMGSSGEKTFNAGIDPFWFIKQLVVGKAKEAESDAQVAEAIHWSAVYGELAKELKEDKVNEAGKIATNARSHANTLNLISSVSISGLSSIYGISDLSGHSFNIPAIESEGYSYQYRGNLFPSDYAYDDYMQIMDMPGAYDNAIANNNPIRVASSLDYVANIESKTINANGYGHNIGHQELQQNGDVVQDYYVERQSIYAPRDRITGIPFSNRDRYSVMGSGIRGEFNMTRDDWGYYYKNQIDNSIPVHFYGVKYGFNPDFPKNELKVRLPVGAGNRNTTIRNWNKDDQTIQPQYQWTQSDFSFRFKNDPGGAMTSTVQGSGLDNEPLDVELQMANPTSTNYKPQITGIAGGIDNVVSGQTSVIEYVKNSQISNTQDFASSALDQTSETENWTVDSRTETSIADGIAQFSITDANASRYIYGIPVYNKDVVELNMGLKPNANIVDHKIVYQDVNEYDPQNLLNDPDHINVVGEEKNVPYASEYLLTQVLSPDYYDVNGNGPDENDIGGWTKLGYDKSYGGSTVNGDWYRWRIPYTGFHYGQGRTDTDKDDFAKFSSGLREVYNLKYVETATHIAYFVTNESCVEDYLDCNTVNCQSDYLDYYLTGTDCNQATGRLDGLSASVNGANDPNAKGTERSRYLERIVLYSKDRMEKPLQVTHFEYDYSLCPSTPNNEGNGAETGKLTLKKVWTDHNGVSRSEIHPYEFEYDYKKATEFSPEVVNRYSFLQSSGDWPSYSSYSQNPTYSSNGTSVWGTYQDPNTGRDRIEKEQYWEDQNPSANLDPAAWHLKRVQLPTGGELLVQYEHDQYRYVQNRPAEMLARINVSNTVDSEDMGNRYYIKTEDLGVDDLSELQEYYDKHSDDLEGRWIYFKFLYSLYGSIYPAIEDCRTGYIDGYAKVFQTGIDANGMYVILNNQPWVNGYNGPLGFLGDVNQGRNPKSACYEYVRNNRTGFIETSDCDCEYDELTDDLQATDFTQHDKQFAKDNFTPLLKDLALQEFHKTIHPKSHICQFFNPELSYFRLPMHDPKLGGGLRVRRILSYDKGLQPGDATLYGTEYTYENENGLCSGVASNEPSAARASNVLTTVIPGYEQNAWSKFRYGKDKGQIEGPISESIMPGAGVGYEVVKVSNIHKGETGSGVTVHRFYTYKDYYLYKHYDTDEIHGYDVEFNSISKKSKNFLRKITLQLSTYGMAYSTNSRWVSQNFRFIKTNMNGAFKSVKTYESEDIDNARVISGQEIEYFEPGEQVKSLEYDALTNSYSNADFIPGKEMVITAEMNETRSENWDVSVYPELEVKLTIPPTILAYINPFDGVQFNYGNASIRTHISSKVVDYPRITKQVTTITDGIRSTSESLAFDPVTGDVLVTKTTDGYHDLELEKSNTGSIHDGSYYSLNIPAHWHYPDAGQKFIDPDNTNQLTATVGNITTYGDNADLSDANWHNAATQNGVIAATIQLIQKNWYDLQVAEDFGSITYANDQIYRPWKVYNYETNVTGSNPSVNADPERNYMGGIFENFSFFDFANPSASASEWKFISETTKYSPHGQALEAKDAAGFYTTVEHQDGGKLPIMTAGNAQYNSVQFESFEWDVNAGQSGHTGEKALAVAAGSQYTLADDISINSQHIEEGSQFMIWVKSEEVQEGEIPIVANLVNAGGPGHTWSNPRIIASTGEWSLIEADFEYPVGSQTGDFNIQVVNQSTTDVIVDDIKMQPTYASSACYVYDINDYKVLAEFGDAHFASIYQYDDEGSLLRSFIETEEGTKLISEQHGNTAGITR